MGEKDKYYRPGKTKEEEPKLQPPPAEEKSTEPEGPKILKMTVRDPRTGKLCNSRDEFEKPTDEEIK